MAMTEKHSIYVTGGTGYIGRRLIPLLAKRGHMVKAVVRAGSENKPANRPWAHQYFANAERAHLVRRECARRCSDSRCAGNPRTVARNSAVIPSRVDGEGPHSRGVDHTSNAFATRVAKAFELVGSLFG
jgi:NAD(P)-dependent dehydrogenase (short-subunit alcohol dehydrogenase family)